MHCALYCIRHLILFQEPLDLLFFYFFFSVVRASIASCIYRSYFSLFYGLWIHTKIDSLSKCTLVNNWISCKLHLFKLAVQYFEYLLNQMNFLHQLHLGCLRTLSNIHFNIFHLLSSYAYYKFTKIIVKWQRRNGLTFRVLPTWFHWCIYF